MSRLVSQTNVAVLMPAFDSTDKQGGFIGAMYAGGTNVAVELVREG
jgi:endonuclease YncB( thermonuclease family)